MFFSKKIFYLSQLLYFCCVLIHIQADVPSNIRSQASLPPASAYLLFSLFILYMADVVEVVHKISYEVDDKALELATVRIEKQIQDVRVLTDVLKNYQLQLASVKASETARFNELSRKIDETNKKLDASGSKLKGMLLQVANGMLKGFNLGPISTAVEDFTEKLVSGFKKVDSFNFSSIASLATNLFSFTSIAPLAISFLVDMAAKLFNASDAASEADESYQEYVKTIKNNVKSTFRSVDQQVVDVEVKRMGLRDKDPKVRAGSAKHLKDTYGNLFSGYSVEDIANNKADKQIDNLLAQIRNKEYASGAKTNAVDMRERLRDEEKKLNDAKKNGEDLKKRLADSDKELSNVRLVGDLRDSEEQANKALKKMLEETNAKIESQSLIVNNTKAGINNTIKYSAQYEALSPDLSFPSQSDDTVKPSSVKGSYSSKVSVQDQLKQEAAFRKQHYSNIERLKLENLKRQLKADEEAGKDTVAVQIAISKQETAIALSEAQDRYVEEYKTAKEAKADTKALQQAHQQEMKGIVQQGNDAINNIYEQQAQKNKERRKKEYEYEEIQLQAQSAAEQDKLNEKYVKGGMSYSKYLRERQKLKLETDLKENQGQQGIVNRQLSDAKSERSTMADGSDAAKAQDAVIDKLQIKLSDLKTSGLDIENSIHDLRKQKILDSIADYQALAQAAADAYNTVVQVQIDALDKEIAIREKRVAAAQKLAERGNVEALKIEEDRLQKAQEMRAQFARRQQAVNAAITVSNAIAAVARAALEGGGFGSVATIAALLAALAAGYAAVTSMSNDNAYADGVVDFKGKGGPRDDKNWVRISSGESVITADGTRKNRHLLEAINNGAQLQFINPALAYTMPSFASPKYSMQGYASSYDLRAVEGKLDGVISAIEDNRMKQNIFFNEHGVGVMTERAVRKDRKRWM